VHVGHKTRPWRASLFCHFAVLWWHKPAGIICVLYVKWGQGCSVDPVCLCLVICLSHLPTFEPCVRFNPFRSFVRNIDLGIVEHWKQMLQNNVGYQESKFQWAIEKKQEFISKLLLLPFDVHTLRFFQYSFHHCWGTCHSGASVFVSLLPAMHTMC
jgi:hypothetical protein